MLKLLVESRFKKDLKKLSRSGGYDFRELDYVINELLQGNILSSKYKNHMLTGNLKGYFDCHIKNNWILLYKITSTRLILIRTGTHAEVLGI